jgi:SAM-dependent methyltransferase
VFTVGLVRRSAAGSRKSVTGKSTTMMSFESYYDERWLPKGDYFQTHRKRFLQSWELLDSLDLESHGMVLDVGGAGPLSLYLKEALGWQPSMSFTDLRHALEFKSESFDLVICTETIEHIKDIDSNKISDLELFNYSGVTGMLEEFKRVMKPDALLFMTTPNANSFITLSKWLSGEVLLMDPNHVREFSVRDLVRVTSDVGLEATLVRTCDSWGEHFGASVTDLKALFENVPLLDAVERDDNIFAVFRKAEIADAAPTDPPSPQD